MYRRPSHAISSFLSEVNTRWKGRPTASDGIVGDLAHSARTSDHNPDENGIVHACDVTEWHDAPGGDMISFLREFLRHQKDKRTKYVISRGQIFTSYTSLGRAAWTWRTYYGINRHDKHMHHSVYGDDGSPWGLLDQKLVVPPPPKRVLKLGMIGEDVKGVKNWLALGGYTKGVSRTATTIRTYGVGTKAAVRLLQQHGIAFGELPSGSDTGDYGPATHKWLFKVIQNKLDHL